MTVILEMRRRLHFEAMAAAPREEILGRGHRCFCPRSKGFGAPYGTGISIGAHEDDTEVCIHILDNLVDMKFVENLSTGFFKREPVMAKAIGMGLHAKRVFFGDADEGDEDDWTEPSRFLSVPQRALGLFHGRNCEFWEARFDGVFGEQAGNLAAVSNLVEAIAASGADIDLIKQALAKAAKAARGHGFGSAENLIAARLALIEATEIGDAIFGSPTPASKRGASL